MFNTDLLSIVATTLFALAVVHTFCTGFFESLAHRYPRHAGLWHLLGEVETVFGFWALLLVLAIAAFSGGHDALLYLNGLNFTEPMFVFVIMVIAATRPILELSKWLTNTVSALLPFKDGVSDYFVCLFLVPLLGSLITEPAAMTLAALILRDRFYRPGISARLMYATLGVLFVNVSIGGVLTPYAAPPVLMVANQWGWDLGFMASTFGWKAAIAVAANAMAATVLFRRELAALPDERAPAGEERVPALVMLIHVAFLGAAVAFSHYPIVFVGLLMFFLGYVTAYPRHQSPLLLKEGLMVAFFLAGLVVLGGRQQWWLQPVLAGMNDLTLFLGAATLTAITDNAALTYLGSLVEGTSEGFRYALVAGAVTGGGLTVIANAPNPAGYALLKPHFPDENIRAGGLFLAALGPTLVAAACFMLL